MKYCFAICCGSRLELFSYNGDDDKFILTPLNSAVVEGLNSVLWSAQGLHLICLIRKNLYVHNHDFETIVHTMPFPGFGNVVDASFSPGKKYLVLFCKTRFVQTTCDCGGELITIIWSFRGERVYEFPAGVTMYWGGRFPVAEHYEELETNYMEDDCEAIRKRIPEICI